MEQPNKISNELVAQKQEALAATSQEKIQSLRNAARELNTPTLQPTVALPKVQPEPNTTKVIDSVNQIMSITGANPKDILTDLDSMPLLQFQHKYGFEGDVAAAYVSHMYVNKVAPERAREVRQAVIDEQGVLSKVADLGVSAVAGGASAVGGTLGFGTSLLAEPEDVIPSTVDTITGLVADFTGNEDLRTSLTARMKDVDLPKLPIQNVLGHIAGGIYQGTEAVTKGIKSVQSDALNARNQVRQEENDAYTKELKDKLGDDAGSFENMVANTKIGLSAFMNLLKDPASALNVAAESAPSLLIAGGVAGAASKSVLKNAQEQIARDMMKAGPVSPELISKAIIAQGEELTKKQVAAGTKAGIITSGALEGAGAASEVYNSIIGTDFETLSKVSDRYNEILETIEVPEGAIEGYAEEESRRQLAIESSLGAGTVVTAVAAGITAVSFASDVINKVGGVDDTASTGIKASAADAFKEGVEETFQSFTSAYVSGTKERENINPDLDVGARAAIQAGEGALAGALTGGSIPLAASAVRNTIEGVENFDTKVRSTADRNLQARRVRESGVTKESANTDTLGYSLFANVKGMAANNSKQDVTLEQVENNIDLMAEAVTSELATIDQLKEIYDSMSRQEKSSKKGKAILEDMASRGKELDKASKLIMEEAAKYQARKTATKSVDTAIDNLTKGTPESDDNSIVLGSMASFELSDIQVDTLVSSPTLSEEQKKVFSTYKETKRIVDSITEKADKDIQGVNTEVISGGPGFIGITQYLTAIGSSLKLGNPTQANKSLSMLEAFSNQRVEKVQDLQEGYDLFMKGSAMTDADVARIKEIEAKYTLDGGKPFKIGVGTPKLLPVIQEEAELTLAAVEQGTAMLAGVEIKAPAPKDTTVEETPATEAPIASEKPTKTKKTSQEMTAETLANIPNMTQQQLLDGKARREKLLAKEGKVAMKPETIEGLKVELAAINEALSNSTPKGSVNDATNIVSQTTKVTPEVIETAYNTPKAVPTNITKGINDGLSIAIRDEYDNLAFDNRPVQSDYSKEDIDSGVFAEDQAAYDESAELYNIMGSMFKSELPTAQMFKETANKYTQGSVVKLMEMIIENTEGNPYGFVELFDNLNNSQLDFGQGSLILEDITPTPVADAQPEATLVADEAVAADTVEPEQDTQPLSDLDAYMDMNPDTGDEVYTYIDYDGYAPIINEDPAVDTGHTQDQLDIIEPVSVTNKLATEDYSLAQNLNVLDAGTGLSDINAPLGNTLELVPRDTVTDENVAKENKEISSDTFRQTNLFKKYFKIIAKQGNTTNPLLTVKDFMSTLKDNVASIAAEFGEYSSITGRQRRLLETVADYHTDFRESMLEIFKGATGTAAQYKYVDMMQFLTDQSGMLEDNVIAALSLTAFNFESTKAADTLNNDDSTIREIFGIDKETVIPREVYEMARHGTIANQMYATLGKQAMSALGITPRNSFVPTNHVGNFAESLGQMIVATLTHQGSLVYAPPVNTKRLATLLGDFKLAASLNGKEQIHLVHTALDGKYARPVAEVRKLGEVMRGTQGILEKIFKVESFKKGPSFAPIEKVTKKVRGTNQTISPLMEDIIKKHQDRPHKFKHDIHARLMDMPEPLRLKMLGYIEDKSNTHDGNLASVESANAGILRGLEHVNEFYNEIMFNSFDGDPEFYFSHYVMKNGRLGMDSNTFNPQGNKVHRHLVSMEGWESTFIPNGSDTLKEALFFLAFAQGMGIGIDKTTNDKAIAKAKEILDSEDVKNAVQALVDSKGKDITPEQAEAIANGVAKGEEKMWSFEALVAMADYEIAKRDGTEFKHSLILEADGITNGPAIASVQFGVGATIGESLEKLHKVGIYLLGTNQEYGEFRSTNGNFDNYETVTLDLDAQLQKIQSPFIDLGNAVFGSLVVTAGEDGSLKVNRSISKQPLMTTIYGVGDEKLANNIGNSAITAIYEILESRKEANIQQLLKALANVGVSAKTLKGFSNPSTALSTLLTPSEERMIQSNIAEIYGGKMNEAIDASYWEFKNTARTVNAMYTNMFDNFKRVFDYLISERTKQLQDAGVLAVSVNKTTGSVAPLESLPKAEVDAIMDELISMQPIIGTLFSEESENLRNGVYVGKTQTAAVEDNAHKTEQKYKIEIPSGTGKPKKSSASYSSELQLLAPGVSPVVLAIQNYDAVTMMLHLEKYGSLNIYDAIITGVDQIIEHTQDMNRAHMEAHSQKKNIIDQVMAADARSRASYAKYAPVLGQYTEIPFFKLKNLAVAPTDLPKISQKSKNIVSNITGMSQYYFENATYVPENINVPTVSDITKAVVESGSEAKSLDVLVDPEAEVSSYDLSAIAGYTSTDIGNVIKLLRERVRGRSPLASQVRDMVGRLWAKSVNPDLDMRTELIAELDNAEPNVLDGFMRSMNQLVEAAPKGKLYYDITPDAFIQDLFKDTDTITADAAINMMVKELPKTTATGKGIAYIMKKIQPLVKDTPITIIRNAKHLKSFPVNVQSFFGTANDGARGGYFKNGNSIYIIAPELHSNGNTGATFEVVAHELLHAALLGKLDYSSKNSVSKEVELAQKELVNIFNEVKKIPELNDGSNAMSNIDELVSWAFTNVKVQEVMKGTTLKSKTLLGQNAFTAFVKKLSTIIFGKPVDNPDVSNAMVRLTAAVNTIVNSSLGYIDTDGSLGSASISTNMFQSDLETKIDAASASTVFDMLDGVGNKAETPNHKDTLKNVLDSVTPVLKQLTLKLQSGVNTTHGLIKGSDVYMWTQLVGKRNNSQAISKFDMSAQEVYVHELIHSVTREAIRGNSRAKKALHSLWDRARKTITVDDLAGAGVVKGSPEWQAAKEQWDYMFTPKSVNADGSSNHLQEFAALGMTNERIGKLLASVPHRIVTPQSNAGFSIANLLDAITDYVHHVINIITNKLTDTSGMDGQETLNALVLQLAGVTAQNKNLLMSTLDKGGQGLGVLGDVTVSAVKRVVSPLAKLANDLIIKPSGSAVLKVGTRTLSMMATSNKLPALVMMNAIDNLTNYNAGKQNILGEMYTEAKGLTERNSVFTTLARLKNASVDTARENTKAHIAKVLNKVFDNLELSKEEYSAITAGFLRADVSALQLTHKEMVSIYSGSKDLDKRIAEEVSKLSGDPEFDYYISRAKALGMYMVTEIAPIHNLNMNAHQIANLFGETRTNPNADTVEPIIDRLASLYAIKYTPSKTKYHLAKALAKSNGQAKDANAFEFLSNFHNEIKAKDQEALFNDEERANIIKGYTRDIVDPRTQVVTMTDQEAIDAELLNKGWELVGGVDRDPADPIQTPVNMYIYRFGAEAGIISGIVSTTSKNAKGQNTTDIVMNPSLAKGDRKYSTFAKAEAIGKQMSKQITRNVNAANQKLTSNFDPLSVKGNRMVPTYDLNGNVQGYRYIMTAKTKDTILARDNNFVNVLAVQSGRTVEKVAAARMNVKAIDALADAFKQDAADGKLGGYVTFGPDSTDPEILELYRLLPYEAKKQLRAAFGNRNAQVHKELLHLVFGQRKLSLADKAQYDNLQGSMMKQALAMSFGLLGKPFGLKPNQTISAIGQAWQDYVQVVKQYNIIKSGVVTVQNTISNTYQLYVRGLSPSDILKYNVEAYVEANNYIYDIAKLKELEVMVETGYQSSKRAEQDAEIALLRTKIAENPVAGLITDGMLQSIVEDVDMVQDTYSASNWISDKVMNNEYVSKVPNWVRRGGQEIFMTQGSTLYKGMAKAAQLSDFAARYALYKHLSENSKVARDDAINQAMEVFVNYDYSTNKYIQWLNDNGMVWYTKYYLRIQKTILGDIRNAPGRVLGVLALDMATGNAGSHIYSTIATPENILNRMGLPEGPIDMMTNAATIEMVF